MKSPEDQCEVCLVTRENHGDKNHKFSEDGVLVPLEPAKPAENAPPARRGEKEERLPTPANFVALLDILISKDLLNAYEVAYILGGGGDSLGRPSSGSTKATGD